MQFDSDRDGKIASFARKRLSLEDSYDLEISSEATDRRRLVALGVRFEAIHD